MTRPQFVNGEIYHVFNKGIDKRNIFLNNIDYIRFIHDLFFLNDEERVVPSNIRLAVRLPSQADFNPIKKCLELRTLNITLSGGKAERKILNGVSKRKKRLVDILVFSLMPTHFHLLLRQRIDRGISRFMNKLGIGYVMYFNQKYNRSGALFGGRFKAVHVTRQEHLEYLFYYIHFNCLDLIDAGWRVGSIRDYNKMMAALNRYRWSSHLDYWGKKNFPSVTQRDFFRKIIGIEGDYQGAIEQWLRDIVQKLQDKNMKPLTLEERKIQQNRMFRVRNSKH